MIIIQHGATLQTGSKENVSCYGRTLLYFSVQLTATDQLIENKVSVVKFDNLIFFLFFWLLLYVLYVLLCLVTILFCQCSFQAIFLCQSFINWLAHQ